MPDDIAPCPQAGRRKGRKERMLEMRAHIAAYTAGYPHCAALRREVNQIETYRDLENLLESRREGALNQSMKGGKI